MPMTAGNAEAATQSIHIKVRPSVKESAMKNAENIGIPLSALLNAFLIRFANTGVVPFELAVTQEPNEGVYQSLLDAEAGNVSRAGSLEEMYSKMGIRR